MKFEYSLNKNNYVNAVKTKYIKIVEKIMTKLLKWQFETIMYNNFQSKDIDNFKVSIGDNNITIVSDISKIHIGWKAVKSVKVTQNFIVIKYGLNKKATISLKLNAFKNEDEKLQLINAIEQKMIEKNNYPLPLFMSENTFLKLKFIYSEEDEQNFYKYEMSNSSRGKKISIIEQYIFPVFFLIMTIVSCIKGSTIYTVISIFLVVWSYFYIRKAMKSTKHLKGLNKACKKLLIKNKDYYNPKSEKNIILTDEGIYFQNSDVIIFIEWEKVNNYEFIESNNYIGMSIKNSVIFWAPTSVFKSKDEKDEFMNVIEKHLGDKSNLPKVTKKMLM